MGVDEAGRGCLAGPVVAAAVILKSTDGLDELDDSKALSGKTRDRLFDVIKENAAAIGIGVVSAAEIDGGNILAATLTAMHIAVTEAAKNYGHRVGIVIVDGNQQIKGLAMLQRAWVKGDHLSWNCAAASVIAKVTRDRIMERLDSTYPGYGFAQHKGYGTAKHLAALKALGPCPEHRRSFAPVKDLLRP